MPRLRIAIFAIAVAAGFLAPAAARAAVTTNITTWTSSSSGTPANSPYLISFDNQPTTLAVSGTAPGVAVGQPLDIVCYYGSPSHYIILDSSPTLVVKPGGTFSTGSSPLQLRAMVHLACRLRAIPRGDEATSDSSSFAGPSVAVAETALLTTISGGPNDNIPYNFYVNGMTLTGVATWEAPGTPANHATNSGACGGPAATPIDPALDIDTAFPLNCAGSLLSDDLGTWGGRSEIEVDGRNAYDAAAAQALFPRSSGFDGSEDLAGFPSMKVAILSDPRNGLISSRSVESLVRCDGPDPYRPASIATCPKFDDTGVSLTRVETTSDGGRVITLTDTWSSTDGHSHSLDLLYDDYSGVVGSADGQRGWQFPGQSGFGRYATGDAAPTPAGAPDSILVRTNVTAPDGDPDEGFGAITFGHAPAGLRFAGDSELEEHQLLAVPAGGSASLSYVYSVGYTLANITALALQAQDRFQPAAVHIISPSNGAAVATPTVTLTGAANAGSGIKSLVVGGQAVPVASDGSWTAQVPLSQGSNTITASLIDAAGAAAQSQVVVVYQPPPPVVKCKVPRTKGMKLMAAKKALRRAHCRVGKVRHLKSHRVRRGRVTGTSPRAGRRLPAGRKVELFVSKGR